MWIHTVQKFGLRCPIQSRSPGPLQWFSQNTVGVVRSSGFRKTTHLQLPNCRSWLYWRQSFPQVSMLAFSIWTFLRYDYDIECVKPNPVLCFYGSYGFVVFRQKLPLFHTGISYITKYNKQIKLDNTRNNGLNESCK